MKSGRDREATLTQLLSSGRPGDPRGCCVDSPRDSFNPAVDGRRPRPFREIEYGLTINCIGTTGGQSDRRGWMS